MNWLIALDVVLWIAAGFFLISAWIISNFIYVLIGLACVVLAVVLLCIMTGKPEFMGALDDFDFDI